MQKRNELPRVGETVETVCLLMSLLSLAGGVVCAVQFGKVMHMGYAGSIRAEVSPVLVAAWVAGGIVSAIFWWVLGRIGTALRWLEATAPSMAEMPVAQGAADGAKPKSRAARQLEAIENATKQN